MLPAPGSLSTVIRPPLCRTISLTVARPSPVPFPSSLVVKNGSNYRPETSDIWCACHNAVFDVGGNIVSGPPPRPLERLTVNVSGEDLVVSRG